MSDALMRARDVTKVYGATRALRGVDFDVRAGRVTALFGENGAGKSTLMKILSGVEQPTSGTIELDGAPVRFRSAGEAAAQGVVIIHQELSLFPNLSIADNLFMGRELARGGVMVDGREQRRIATELLQRLEEPLDPSTPVGELRLGQQQLVEIARALAQDARVLIMDEPTSALSTVEVDVLFRVIRDLVAQGVAIVYISHHIEEALEISDDVVVVRDGALVATARSADVDLGWIVAQMVGRDPDALFGDEHADVGDGLLTIRDLTIADPIQPGRVAVDNLSLTVRAGEVVGLYGLMGAGRTELLETLAGRVRAAGGTMEIDGVPLARDGVGGRLRQGIALVPEDRQRDGLVPSMTVGENLSLASLGRFTRRGTLSKQIEKDEIDAIVRDVTVKTAGADAPIGSLSGGNQQKVVIGKALMSRPRVLLLDEPTRGIDVGAKADIFALIARLAESGMAVVFATSEVEEALHVPDRLLVLSRGRVVKELRRGATTREEIMAASEGLTQAGAAS